MFLWAAFFLLFEFPLAIFSEQDGFLSLSCGGVDGYVDALNIKWTPDSNYITTGNTTAVNYIDGTSSSSMPLRFFSNTGGRNCYHLPLPKSSSPTSVLLRAKFVYKNYDNLRRPPAFSVSVGTSMASDVNLNKSDPWTEEFVWPVKKNYIPLCFHSIPNAGNPVVSSIEVRPLPKGASSNQIGNKLLRKSYRINCGVTNGSLRYPADPYDRIWDSDWNFSPSKTSTAAYSTLLNSNATSARELAPMDVLKTARVSLRKSTLTYNLKLGKIGDYYIVLYFAGILRRSPSFNVLINGDLVQSNYTLKDSGVDVLYLTQHTTISALQVIQQYTGLDLGWQDDPCSPKPWNHVLCEGSLVRSLGKGNLCLLFSTSSCDRIPDHGPIEEPKVAIINTRKNSGHQHIALILAAIAGAATDNFKKVIGRGSFGPVYFGKLADGKTVAVKVRSDRTQLGADSFINEEAKHQILIYEYLPGGSLADNLYGTNSKKFTLSWVRRLKIAVDAAKGLEYLHNGTEPRIIHRDVKCSNILLDNQMNAKVCDFGLCKQLAGADATHVTTVVKGTAGYLDPESVQSKLSFHSHANYVHKLHISLTACRYYTTQQLTEKSDVYSFGVVLLELICGREPLTHSGAPDTFNLARPFLKGGTFEIVDESIKGRFDKESIKIAAFLASRCIERDASLRPTIAEVLDELKQAYSIQLAYLATTGHSN
ncbi:hypothetical protein V2J09_022022 [Rumex salicifolius]